MRLSRLGHWCGTVAALGAAGALFGWATGLMLARLSGDYVVRPPDYALLGLRAGFLAGTVMAAWQTNLCPVCTPVLGVRAIARGLAEAGLTACTVLLLAALCSVWLGELPAHANLAHPRRHLLYLALHHALPWAIMAGVIPVAVQLWRRRSG